MLSTDLYTFSRAWNGDFSNAHFKCAGKGNLGHRAVHYLVGGVEKIPLLGKIVSLFELALFQLFGPKENLPLIEDLKKEVKKEIKKKEEPKEVVPEPPPAPPPQPKPTLASLLWKPIESALKDFNKADRPNISKLKGEICKAAAAAMIERQDLELTNIVEEAIKITKIFQRKGDNRELVTVEAVTVQVNRDQRESIKILFESTDQTRNLAHILDTIRTDCSPEQFKALFALTKVFSELIDFIKTENPSLDDLTDCQNSVSKQLEEFKDQLQEGDKNSTLINLNFMKETLLTQVVQHVVKREVEAMKNDLESTPDCNFLIAILNELDPLPIEAQMVCALRKGFHMLTDFLKNEHPSLEQFVTCYKEVFTEVRDFKEDLEEAEQESPVGKLKQVGAGLVNLASEHIKPVAELMKINLNDAHDRNLNNNLKNWLDKTPHLFGAEVKLELKMEVEKDALVAQEAAQEHDTLLMQLMTLYPDEDVGRWIEDNLKKDLKAFSEWIQNQINRGQPIQADSIDALFQQFSQAKR